MRIGEGGGPVGGPIGEAGGLRGRGVRRADPASAEHETEHAPLAAGDAFRLKVQALATRVKEIPEVREDVVAEARRLLDSGELDSQEAYEETAAALLRQIAAYGMPREGR